MMLVIDEISWCAASRSIQNPSDRSGLTKRNYSTPHSGKFAGAAVVPPLDDYCRIPADSADAADPAAGTK